MLGTVAKINVCAISAGDHEVPGNPEITLDTVVQNYVQAKSWGLLIFLQIFSNL